MIPIALASALWLPALLGLGAALLAWQRVGDEWGPDGVLRLSVCGALGCLGLSVLGNAANFLVPVHPSVSLAGWAIGMACAWSHRDLLLSSVQPFDWLALALILLVCASATATQPLVYDEGLYHLPAIKWLTDSPVPLGLGQLHSRLGFNSSWHTLTACLELPRLYGRGLFVALCLLLFLFGLLLYDGLRRVIAGDARIVTWVQLGFAYVWGLALLRGWLDYPHTAVWLSLTDTASAYVVFLALVLMLRRTTPSAAQLTESLLLGSVALLGVTGKLSNAVLVIGAALVLARRVWAVRGNRSGPQIPNLRRAFRRAGLLWLAVVLVWMLRGVALTGSVAYPSTVGHFQGLPWALVESELQDMQGLIKSWARAPGVLPPSRVLTGHAWLEPWCRRVEIVEAVRVCRHLVVGGILLLALRGLGQLFVRRPKERPEPALHADAAVAALVMLGGVTQCFLSAPEPRLGLGFLFGLSALMAAAGAHAIALPILPRAIRIIVACGILVAGLRGGRVLSWQPDLLTPMWPRIPAATLVPRKTTDGVIVYVGSMGWLGPLPNSTQLDARLKVRLEANGLPSMFWYDPDSRKRPPFWKAVKPPGPPASPPAPPR